MIVVVGLALAAATVPLFGGRLSRLRGLQVRHEWLLWAALGVQVVIVSLLPTTLPHAVAATLHLGSYAAAVAWLVANRHVTGMWVVAAGGCLNLAAILANGGVMPASPAALHAAGLPPVEGFANSSADPSARLAFLGDVFNVPSWVPLANVFSAGDLVLVLGGAVVLHTACGSLPATSPRSWRRSLASRSAS